MTTTITRNSIPSQGAGASVEEVQSSGVSVPAGGRTVHSRKLAVMAKCGEIVPDKTHPAHGFRYISIQNLSNHLRRFCAEEGLDIVTSITDGTVVVELVNAEDPSQRIVSTWPVVAGDKGYAFSIKFPLMRLFLVGDGEENDEAEMADRSATTVSRPTATARPSSGPQTAAKPAQATRAKVGEKIPCEACATAGYKNKRGYPAVIWDDRWDCDGVDPEGDAQRHPRKVDVLSIDEPQTFADGSPIPAEIPW